MRLGSGATVRDQAAGNIAADLTAAVVNSSGVLISTEASSTGISSDQGSFAPGDEFHVGVLFNQPVTVVPGGGGELPNIRLDIGGVERIVPYSAAATADCPAPSCLNFIYTVQADDEDLDGIPMGIGDFLLNGADVVNSNGRSAQINLNPVTLSGALIGMAAATGNPNSVPTLSPFALATLLAAMLILVRRRGFVK